MKSKLGPIFFLSVALSAGTAAQSAFAQEKTYEQFADSLRESRDFQESFRTTKGGAPVITLMIRQFLDEQDEHYHNRFTGDFEDVKEQLFNEFQSRFLRQRNPGDANTTYFDVGNRTLDIHKAKIQKALYRAVKARQKPKENYKEARAHYRRTTPFPKRVFNSVSRPFVMIFGRRDHGLVNERGAVWRNIKFQRSRMHQNTKHYKPKLPKHYRSP